MEVLKENPVSDHLLLTTEPIDRQLFFAIDSNDVSLPATGISGWLHKIESCSICSAPLGAKRTHHTGFVEVAY